MNRESFDNDEPCHDTGLNCIIDCCIYAVGIIAIVVIFISIYLFMQ